MTRRQGIIAAIGNESKPYRNERGDWIDYKRGHEAYQVELNLPHRKPKPQWDELSDIERRLWSTFRRATS